MPGRSLGRAAGSTRWALATVVAAGVLGCGLYETREMAQGTAKGYFAAVAAGRPELALSFYGSELFDATPVGQVRELVQALVALGEPESVDLISWRSEISSAGRRATMAYTATYPECAITHKMEIRLERGEEAGIVGHQVEGMEGCRPERMTA